MVYLIFAKAIDANGTPCIMVFGGAYSSMEDPNA